MSDLLTDLPNDELHKQLFSSMESKTKKVYSLGIVSPHEGENIEVPIFTSVKNAIKYMEDVIIKLHWPNSKFERDDSELDDKEMARWYQLRPTQQLNDNKVTWSENILRRSDNYYRVFERELI